MRRLSVLLFDPALGQHIFLFRLQQREFADFLQVAVQPTFGRRGGKICIICHQNCPFRICKDLKISPFECCGRRFQATLAQSYTNTTMRPL